MKQISFLLFCLYFMSCMNRTVIEVKDDAGNVVESYEVDKKTEKKNGIYQRFNNQTLVERADYVNDTLHGMRTLFFDDGIKEIEESYVAGKYHGAFRTYHPDGSLKLEGVYENGTMESTWIKYYPSGQIMERVEMHLNNENGPFEEFYENGNLKAKGSYLDGDNEDGELLLYDENGDLERKMDCDKGICHTTWSREK